MSSERRTIAEAMAETGTTSPSAALRKLNAGRDGVTLRKLVYMPHRGAKQKAKAARAAAQQTNP